MPPPRLWRKSTAGLLLQVFIAADVVCIGMGVDDGVQAPSFPVHNLTYFPSGVLVAAAVNQTYREPSIRNTPILAGQLM